MLARMITDICLVPTGCPARTCPQRRSLHSRADPLPPGQLGDRVGLPVLPGALLPGPVTLHPHRPRPGWNPLSRPQGARHPLLRHLPTRRHDAAQASRRQALVSRALARPHVRIQGCCPPAPRQPVRVLPPPQEPGQVWLPARAAHHRRCYLGRHGLRSHPGRPIQAGHFHLYPPPQGSRQPYPGGADDHCPR